MFPHLTFNIILDVNLLCPNMVEVTNNIFSRTGTDLHHCKGCASIH